MGTFEKQARKYYNDCIRRVILNYPPRKEAIPLDGRTIDPERYSLRI